MICPSMSCFEKGWKGKTTWCLALTNKPNLRAITFLLKVLSINIVLVFTIYTDSVQVSYTYSHRTIVHIEYIGNGDLQRAGSKHHYASEGLRV